MSKQVSRLYSSFRPTSYTVFVALDPNKLTFSGTVTINGAKVGRPSKRITFHQKDLRIIKATITKHAKEGTENIPIKRINTHSAYDEVRLHTETDVYPGTYSVTISYSGSISNDMHGIYPSRFIKDGVQKVILATQFESHHAREALPCIDEPEAKATFNLTVQAPKELTVLSNTPELDTSISGGTKTVRFDTTPRMSTYLLAFVAGDLHCKSAKTKQGIEVRSWCAVNQPKRMLNYSVDEAVKILEFFSDYFGIDYPLKKCDQVALPDFDAGAMENWGLITYREIVLLTDPRNPSITTEQYVSLVVAHELSHQWFGNLVTMKWWDDLWLNESFASIMEHLALDAIHPNWRQWELYTAMDVVSTSSRDVYNDIQPVGVKVTDPDLIETLFDPGIVYAKGGRLLKMLREYIGDHAFRSGLTEYFKAHAYGNASRNDLWEALTIASGTDIAALMTPWIERPGMPVVHVEQSKKIVKLSQERFLLDVPEPVKSSWPIPLLATSSIRPNVLSKESAVHRLSDEDYIVLNQWASGHYFVDYVSEKHRKFIAAIIASPQFPTEAKIGLLNDSFMLARKGFRSLTDALNLALACKNNSRDSVWALIARIFGASLQLCEGDDITFSNIKNVKVGIAKKHYQSLGWEETAEDDVNIRQFRHTILSFMISGDDADATKHAAYLYAQAKHIADLPAEIRNTILGAAVRTIGRPAVDTLLQAYPNASAELQLDITSALSSTRDPKIAKHVLSTALGNHGMVRAQDLMRWVVGFIRNHYVRNEGWKYLAENWEYIFKVLQSSKSFDYLPIYCAGAISTEAELKRFKSFFEPKQNIKAMQRNILIGIADAEARILWRKRDENALRQYFKALQ